MVHIDPEVRKNYEALVDAGRFAGWAGLRAHAEQEEASAGIGRSLGTHESGGWAGIIALCDEHLAAEKPTRAAGGKERAVSPTTETRPSRG